MKICPQCRNTYTDDSLQYCLQDGNPLDNYTTSESPTANWSESETLVAPRQPARYDTQKSPSQNWQESQETVFSAEPPEPEKSSTVKVVLLTLLGMIVLFAVGGTAAFIIWKNSQKEVATNTNTKPVNTKTPVANKTANANVNSNANTNVATPTPKPTLNPEEIEQTKENVGNAVDDWRSSYESLDLEYAMNYYADTVDYYNGGRVGIGKVRADKQRAFDAYDTIKFSISNLNVTPDVTGDKATAVFDKEWLFENAEKTNSGKVQQQLKLAKVGGKWKITSEKDIKIYYVNK